MKSSNLKGQSEKRLGANPVIYFKSQRTRITKMTTIESFTD